MNHAIAENLSFNELLAEINRLERENNKKTGLIERLKNEAQIHAQEARTQKSIVLEIYQYCGVQKGDWNGAEPVIGYIDLLIQRIKDLYGDK